MGSLRDVRGALVEVKTSPEFLAGPSHSMHLDDIRDNLDALILESVDETLGDLLGRKAREAVYDYLERNHFMARSEIPKCLDEFFSALERTFGKGSKTIGRVIAKKLYVRLGLEFNELPNTECVDYVELAKAKLEK